MKMNRSDWSRISLCISLLKQKSFPKNVSLLLKMDLFLHVIGFCIFRFDFWATPSSLSPRSPRRLTSWLKPSQRKRRRRRSRRSLHRRRSHRRWSCCKATRSRRRRRRRRRKTFPIFWSGRKLSLVSSKCDGRKICFSSETICGSFSGILSLQIKAWSARHDFE